LFALHDAGNALKLADTIRHKALRAMDSFAQRNTAFRVTASSAAVKNTLLDLASSVFLR
jgi:hypothetical protein